MKKVKLSHTVLYAKGWYKHTDDFWEDIKKCLTADGFGGEYFTKRDCARVLLNSIEGLDSHRTRLSAFASDISPQDCWKIGYYCKENLFPFRDNRELEDYDLDKAVAMFVISVYIGLSKDEFVSTMPNYKDYGLKGNGRGCYQKALKHFAPAN